MTQELKDQLKKAVANMQENYSPEIDEKLDKVVREYFTTEDFTQKLINSGVEESLVRDISLINSQRQVDMYRVKLEEDGYNVEELSDAEVNMTVEAIQMGMDPEMVLQHMKEDKASTNVN